MNNGPVISLNSPVQFLSASGCSIAELGGSEFDTHMLCLRALAPTNDRLLSNTFFFAFLDDSFVHFA